LVWRQKWRMEVARICRLCASKSSAKPQQRKSPNWHQFGLFGYGCQPRHCKILFICTISIPSASQPKLYNLHHSESTLLHRTIAGHCETLLDLFCAGQFDVQSDHCTSKPYVRQAFCKHLERGPLTTALPIPAALTACTTMWCCASSCG
jgi:hypothetical protein